MDVVRIKLLILDVDGVLTDGRLRYAPDGERTKTFHVQDGCALKLWGRLGGRTAIISGRNSRAVVRRASELGVTWLRLGVEDKCSALQSVVEEAGLDLVDAACVADDLPDLGVMARCGWAAAVRNAVPAVKRAADYITLRAGGEGAVAEVVEVLLRRQRRWTEALAAPI